MKYYINRTNPSLNGLDAIFSDLFGDGVYGARIPQVDVYETPSSYVVEAEVAGYSEGDVSDHENQPKGSSGIITK